MLKNKKEQFRLYRTFNILGDEPTLRILFYLNKFGEKNFTELRDELEINPATLSKRLKVLTKFELITPDKSHDQLRVYYSLDRHQKQLTKVLDSIERLSYEI